MATVSYLVTHMIVFLSEAFIIIVQSKNSEAAKSLIQEGFLLCSCIRKVTVVETLIPDELTTLAYTGFTV